VALPATAAARIGNSGIGISTPFFTRIIS
jgi:hypothetical protein